MPNSTKDLSLSSISLAIGHGIAGELSPIIELPIDCNLLYIAVLSLGIVAST